MRDKETIVLPSTQDNHHQLRVVEAEYDRLRRRRAVRIALKIAKAARPLFRTVRAMRKFVKNNSNQTKQDTTNQPVTQSQSGTYSLNQQYGISYTNWTRYVQELRQHAGQEMYTGDAVTQNIVVLITIEDESEKGLLTGTINSLGRVLTGSTPKHEIQIYVADSAGTIQKVQTEGNKSVFETETEQSFRLSLQACDYILQVHEGDTLDDLFLDDLWRFATSSSQVIALSEVATRGPTLYPRLTPRTLDRPERPMAGSSYRLVARMSEIGNKIAECRSPIEVTQLFVTEIRANAVQTSTQPLPVVHVMTLEDREWPGMGEDQISLIETVDNVTAIVSTRNNAAGLIALVEILKAHPLVQQIIIVNNQSTNVITREYLHTLQATNSAHVINFHERFNFSRQTNIASKAATGDKILLMNDDVLPAAPLWLELLLRSSNDARIVGPRLLYPDGSIQHLGMYSGYNGIAGHSFRGALPHQFDNHKYIMRPRRVFSLTGACVLMHKKNFELLGGFDNMLGSFLQDVDICLRAGEIGIESVIVPESTLIHQESVSLRESGSLDQHAQVRSRELDWFTSRWNQLTADIDISPFLDGRTESLRLLKLAARQ